MAGHRWWRSSSGPTPRGGTAPHRRGSHPPGSAAIPPTWQSGRSGGEHGDLDPDDLWLVAVLEAGGEVVVETGSRWEQGGLAVSGTAESRPRRAALVVVGVVATDSSVGWVATATGTAGRWGTIVRRSPERRGWLRRPCQVVAVGSVGETGVVAVGRQVDQQVPESVSSAGGRGSSGGAQGFLAEEASVRLVVVGASDGAPGPHQNGPSGRSADRGWGRLIRGGPRSAGGGDRAVAASYRGWGGDPIGGGDGGNGICPTGS